MLRRTTRGSSDLMPRVLFVSHHLPWPVTSGGRCREAELLRRLTSRFVVDLVAVSKVPDRDFAHLHEATALGISARVFPSHPASAAADASPHEARHTSPAARSHLAHVLRPAATSYDLVHVEGHYLLDLLPEPERRTAFLIEHNVESELFEQQAVYEAAPALGAALVRDARLTRRAERRAWRTVRKVAALSPEDASHIRRHVADTDVEVLVAGADHIRIADAPTLGSGSRVLFVANFGYQPNVDAALFLLGDVLPALIGHVPDVEVVVVGHEPPGWLCDAARRDPRLTVTGWVSDLASELDAADVVLCPLRVGRGVKVKLLEALARGCAIVSTPVGLHGLSHLPSDAVRQAEDAEGLAAAVARLLMSPAERRHQQTRALEAAGALPTWDDAADQLASLWGLLIGESVDGLSEVAEA